jgi:hypothetical protein
MLQLSLCQCCCEHLPVCFAGRQQESGHKAYTDAGTGQKSVTTSQQSRTPCTMQQNRTHSTQFTSNRQTKGHTSMQPEPVEKTVRSAKNALGPGAPKTYTQNSHKHMQRGMKTHGPPTVPWPSPCPWLAQQRQQQAQAPSQTAQIHPT